MFFEKIIFLPFESCEGAAFAGSNFVESLKTDQSFYSPLVNYDLPRVFNQVGVMLTEFEVQINLLLYKATAAVNIVTAWLKTASTASCKTGIRE